MPNSKSSLPEISIPHDKIAYLQKELSSIRSELHEDPYIQEATKTLAAGALRSTIGSYWNAVVHDLRVKIIHRGLDLFNKEAAITKSISEYDDFQNHITDYALIEGAYQTGVIDWEGRKMLQQAREVRNIFDGHPKSSDPTILKVFSMIADCNRYVLSQPMPMPIIDINQYIITMDSHNYDQNELAVEQALSELPETYKNELANKLFSQYTKDNTSTSLRSNIEFTYPILWKLLPKATRKQIGLRLDQNLVAGDVQVIELSTSILSIVDGLRYASETSRKIIYEPLVSSLEDSLDDWKSEALLIKKLDKLGSVVPLELVPRLVEAMTLTYVGYKGYSNQFERSNFYSNSAAPRISKMFERFDRTAINAFIDTVKENKVLKSRIKFRGQLDRLRSLGDLLLSKQTLDEDQISFLELLVDEKSVDQFYKSIRLGS